METSPRVEPTILQGIPCYAPEKAFLNDQFPSDNFERLLRKEEGSFWFRSRNRILKYLFARYLSGRPAHVLELGCGTGYVLKGLSELKNLQLTGAEIYLEALVQARRRLPSVRFVQADAARLPFDSEFDAIGAFDVLEHVQEDERVLVQIHRALKPSGFLFVTVPQHAFLWSRTDCLALHKRRYARSEIIAKIERAGFRLRFVSSFVCSLLPFMILSRWLKTGSSKDGTTAAQVCELDVPRILNGMLELGMRVDEWLIRCGFSLPWGGSLVAVAEKI
jgi:SAM-dependent methyltransferase